MRKNKKIIILTILAVVIVAAVAGFLYFYTDLFKSNKQLFYKYISKTEFVDKDISQKYSALTEKMKESNTSSTGNFTVDLSVNDMATNVAKMQNILGYKYNGLNNKKTNQTYVDFTVSSNNQDIGTVKYLKHNNVYAIKLDNILNKYVALENKNLKEFCKKIGIQDVSNIPDSISETTVEDFLKINDGLLNDIKMTYGKVIDDCLGSSNFSNITNSDGTETIELALTENEISDIMKKILDTVKNDDSVLELIIEKAALFGYELNKDSLKTEIQEEIDRISEQNYSDEVCFKIGIVKDGKQAVKTVIDVITYDTDEENSVSDIDKTKTKYTIELSKNTLLISAEVNDKQIIKSETNISNENKILTSDTNIVINMDQTEETTAKECTCNIKYQIDSSKEKEILTNVVSTINISDQKIQIRMNNDVELKEDVLIDAITNENAELLNNKTAQELQNLMTAIYSKVADIYGEKLTMIFSSEELINSNEDAIQKYQAAEQNEEKLLNELKNNMGNIQ